MQFQIHPVEQSFVTKIFINNNNKNGKKQLLYRYFFIIL